MSGFCFHLYTHFRFDHHFRPFPIPEIQRVPLEQMLLRIKIMPLFQHKRSVHDVLNNLIEPPAKESIGQSLKRLRDVGAIDEHETDEVLCLEKNLHHVASVVLIRAPGMILDVKV